MVELATESIATVAILKELFTVSSLIVFRQVSFLLDFLNAMREGSFISVFTISELKVTTELSFKL